MELSDLLEKASAEGIIEKLIADLKRVDIDCVTCAHVNAPPPCEDEDADCLTCQCEKCVCRTCRDMSNYEWRGFASQKDTKVEE